MSCDPTVDIENPDTTGPLSDEQRAALLNLKTIYVGMRSAFSTISYTNYSVHRLRICWGFNHHAGGVCDHLEELINMIDALLEENRNPYDKLLETLNDAVEQTNNIRLSQLQLTSRRRSSRTPMPNVTPEPNHEEGY
jgi:hypothetical protein